MSFSCDGILVFRYGQAWSTQHLVDDARCPSGFGCVSKNVRERTTTTATTTTTKTTTTTTIATTTVTTARGMPSSFVICIIPVLLLGPVYTKRQHQRYDNSAMTLQNRFATHFQVSPLISMRTESLASSQSGRIVDADAWCKRALIIQVVNSLYSILLHQRAVSGCIRYAKAQWRNKRC